MKKKYHKFATLFMLSSLTFLGIAIYGIKNYTDAPKPIPKINKTNFNLTKVKRLQKKKETAKVKKKVKKIKKKLKSLKPVMNTSFKGASYGLNLDDMANIDLDSDLLSTNEDMVMDENSVDTRPRIYDRPAIEFPEKAIVDNIEKGIVEIRMLITKNGTVKNTEILKSSPKGYFEDVTLSMVQDWKFEPATYKGKNVAIWAKQVVRFGE